ncbi:hypothetical protein H4Q26_017555 [Puccinia striiformis f. sp. tritici PST-130]|nr:hypothetical protein H4Q26_017555 [Puccinia striiformis f. sp. tritici PST-130]
MDARLMVVNSRDSVIAHGDLAAPECGHFFVLSIRLAGYEGESNIYSDQKSTQNFGGP